jgi:DNA-binding LytR/AlgR family response regulator
MKIVIIEDEELVAEDLYITLQQIDPDIEIQTILGSVNDALDYFSTHSKPDLIFSDIQLGDGLSFEIYQQIEIDVPIVFCTAFDDYAIEAFQTSGIDYILKPYDKTSIEKAIQKFLNLKSVLAKDILKQYENVKKVLDSYQRKESETFMIHYRDRYLPVALDKIAMFYLENEINHILLFSGKIYLMSNSLEEVEKQVNQMFFRANRQFLVNRNAIREAVEYFPRKLKLVLDFPFDKEIVISKEKRSRFLHWLNI